MKLQLPPRFLSMGSVTIEDRLYGSGLADRCLRLADRSFIMMPNEILFQGSCEEYLRYLYNRWHCSLSRCESGWVGWRLIRSRRTPDTRRDWIGCLISGLEIPPQVLDNLYLVNGHPTMEMHRVVVALGVSRGWQW